MAPTNPPYVIKPTRIVGSLVAQGKVRPFVLDSGQLKLDVYEPDPREVSQRYFSTRSMEQQVREAAGFPIDEVRIGEYFCDRCGNWLRANKEEWSYAMCISCSLDQGTEISEFLDKPEANMPARMDDPQRHEVTLDRNRRAREIFEQACAMAERSQLEDAIDAFASISTNAAEYRAALFNEAVLLARTGYLSDAIARLESLREAEDPSVRKALADCRNAITGGAGSTACADVALKRAE